MNKGAIVSIVAVVAVVIIAIFAIQHKNTTLSPEATSTPSGAEVTPAPPGTVPSTAGAPVVQTSNNAAASNSTAVVSGQVTPNGAQTTYWYEYGKSTALSSKTSAQSIGSGFRSIPAPGYITGLSASTHYFFRLSAKNSFGTVNGTTYEFTTSATGSPPAGAAPAAQTTAATEVERTTANLHGRVDPNRAETSYWFEYGTNTDMGNTAAFQSAGSGDASVAVSVALSGLKPSTTYFFRVNAQNRFGTVNGATMQFTTKGPPAASAPTVDTTAATNVASTSVTFNGRINPNGAASTYWFEYGEDSLLGHVLGSTTAVQTTNAGNDSMNVSANRSGLTRNTQYYYRLVGRNAQGTTQGDIVSFTTKTE